MRRTSALAMLYLLALPAWTQCSLCRLAVEQDPSLGTAFNKAIVLMMIPALAVFAGVFLLAKRSAPLSRRKPGVITKEIAAAEDDRKKLR